MFEKCLCPDWKSWLDKIANTRIWYFRTLILICVRYCLESMHTTKNLFNWLTLPNSSIWCWTDKSFNYIAYYRIFVVKEIVNTLKKKKKGRKKRKRRKWETHGYRKNNLISCSVSYLIIAARAVHSFRDSFIYFSLLFLLLPLFLSPFLQYPQNS